MKASFRLLRFIVVGAIAALATHAFSDSLCEGGDAAAAKADAQFKQAQDLEKAGRAREAYAAGRKADRDCVTDLNSVEALMKRTAKLIAADEEKKSRYEEAFGWYQTAGSGSDAGRMQRKLVETNPNDVNAYGRAIDFFHRNGDTTQEKEVRALALKQVERALADEEKQFAEVGKDSLTALNRARDWAHYAGGGGDLAKARADKRGDALITEDGRRFLELTLKYYEFAENKDKQQKLRDKARTLGDRAAAKGQLELAADYYGIAGDSSKSNAVRKQAETKAEQTEEARRKNFKKEQEELEKELGVK